MTVSPPMALLSIPISTTLIFFFFFTSSITHTQSASNHTCPSYPNCGDIQIHYPFWLNSSTTTTTTTTTNTSYCGYPGFGLTCNQSSNIKFPILHLPNVDYYAIAIDYHAYTVTLIDIDVYHKQCPRANHNFTFDHSLNFFQYTPNDLNLTFLFNCSNPFRDFLQPTTPLSCLQNSYVFPEDVFSKGIGWHSYCSEAVMVPALSDYVNVSDLPNNFGDVLNNGFELNWYHASDCGACEESGGSCFYDNKQGNYAGCLCGDVFQAHKCTARKRTITRKIVIGTSMTATIIILVVAFIILPRLRDSLDFNIFYKGRSKTDSIDVEKFIKDYCLMLPTKFSYSELKKFTNGFRDKLGQGGYGSVYKGKLANDHPIAAKILEKTKDNGQDFINEVATIGRIHHFNIIRLLGFCCEGSRRALIYEYMPNGSLGDLISNEEASRSLGREKLLEIAIGIANGIEYMHNGCDTRILHLDIKPQNVLLDNDYHPKISDFGLAKLYSRKNSVISLTCARGTIGYIAPEVFMRSVGGVTHKSDVYSYGMLLLDMVVGRKNEEFEDERSSMSYFPDWIYTQLDQWNDIAVVDDEGLCIARKMVQVGLWCIQINPSDRPSINRVLEMLEGNEGIEIPPKPFFPSSTGEPLELKSSSTVKDTTSLTSESM